MRAGNPKCFSLGMKASPFTLATEGSVSLDVVKQYIENQKGK